VFSQLKKIRFDLGFDLRGDLRNILLMAFAKVRYRVGYGIAGASRLLHRVRDYQTNLHQVELNVRLVTDEAIDKCYLKPEAGYSSKEWEETKFKELITKLLTHHENTILILGLSKASRVAKSAVWSSQVIDLTEKLSLRELISILSWCHLFYGNDSGPSHLAQALGVPTVVIASGTNEYEKWGIWREPLRVAKHAVSCSPCHLKNCKVENHPCMSEITADEVFHFGEELLEMTTARS
jgi:ADP-heptose:LPS heptosyltransferase